MGKFDESITFRTTPHALTRAIEDATGVTDIQVGDDDQALNAVNHLLHLLAVETYHELGGVRLHVRCVGAIVNSSGPNVTVTLRAQSTGDVELSDQRRLCAQRLSEAAHALQKQLGASAGS